MVLSKHLPTLFITSEPIVIFPPFFLAGHKTSSESISVLSGPSDDIIQVDELDTIGIYIQVVLELCSHYGKNNIKSCPVSYVPVHLTIYIYYARIVPFGSRIDHFRMMPQVLL